MINPLRTCGLLSSKILAQLTIFSTLFLSGCGYQMGQGGLQYEYSTFSMEYADGDQEGYLTSEIIREISSCGGLRYVNCNGDLILRVQIENLFDEPIGYRFDRDKFGQPNERLITTEGRLTSVAIVTVTDRCKGCVVAGPVRIVAKIDFDHDYNTTDDKIPTLSLGQLDDIEVARDTAVNVVDRELAGKIARYLYSIW